MARDAVPDPPPTFGGAPHGSSATLTLAGPAPRLETTPSSETGVIPAKEEYDVYLAGFLPNMERPAVAGAFLPVGSFLSLAGGLVPAVE